MKITIIQADLCWKEHEINRSHFEMMIGLASEADLYLMPEMFSTGFVTRPAGIAEKQGETLRWMTQLARSRGAALAGSIAVEEGGKFYNRFYFVTPEGNVYQYDKRHLFTMGGEKEQYGAGSERLVIEYKGFRIMPLVCYDLRFPVWSRSAGDCDLMLYVASWPVPRIGAWDTLLRARAIENQCYVAGANRVGRDPGNEYDGHSAIIGFKGEVLAEKCGDDEGFVSAVLSREELDAFREKFPAWMDADKFELK